MELLNFVIVLLKTLMKDMDKALKAYNDPRTCKNPTLPPRNFCDPVVSAA